jgi:hypothetical protein
MGESSGYSNNGTYNTFMGMYSGYKNTIGIYNTFMGMYSGRYNTTGKNNTFMGMYSGFKNSTGNYNTFMGRGSGYKNTTGRNNTSIGMYSGYNNSTGSDNTSIGKYSGYNNSTGSRNVYLGYKAGYSATGSNKLYVANSSGTPLIYGDFATGRVGIGTVNPQGKVDINGSIYQRGSVLNADYVFECDYNMESIQEHADYMWKNKHLKAIPKTKVDENGMEIIEMGAHRKGIVEELEKAHIYIEQINKQIATLKTENKQLRGTLTTLVDRQDILEKMYLAISTTLPKEKLAKLNNVELDEVQNTVQ